MSDDNQAPAAQAEPAAQAVELNDERIDSMFSAYAPKLHAELMLGRNNPDFRGLEDITARHARAHFGAGVRAAIEAERDALWMVLWTQGKSNG